MAESTRRVVSADEIQAIKKTESKWADFVLIMLYTGMRPGELSTVHDIDLDKRIMIGGIKTENGKNRHIPIHRDVLSAVARNSVKVGDSRVFSLSG